MKKFIPALLALLGLALPVKATTVTATVVDPNAVAYANGTVLATFIPGPGGPARANVTGSLNSSGAFSITLTDNTTISPVGSKWQVQVCAFAGAPCMTLDPLVISGGSQSLSTQLNAIAPVITGNSNYNFVTLLGQTPVTVGAAGGQTAPLLQVNDWKGSSLMSLSAAGTLTCVSGCAGGAGTIGGTISSTHIPYASAANTLSDISGTAVTGGTGAITLTAGADTTKPLTINSHSATQSASLLDVNNQSSVSADAVATVHGLGTGAFTPGNGPALIHGAQETQNVFGWILTSHDADVNKGAPNISMLEGKMHSDGTSEICGGAVVGEGSNNYSCLYWGTTVGSPAETVTARPSQISGVGTPTTIVPLRTQAATGQTADVFDAINQSETVLSGLDSVGSLFFNGSSSGTAKIGVAAAAGSPCKILLPSTSPTVGQVLSSAAPSGGNCVTSWTAPGAGVSSFSGDGTIITNSASTGAVTASIAGTSGGIPYFNSATSWASSGALAANVLVKGGGAGTAPSGSSLTDAGTRVVGTEPIALADGTVSAPAYVFSGETQLGWFRRTASVLALGIGGTNSQVEIFNPGFRVPSGAPIGWTASATASASYDTALSRDSAGVVDVGTGAAGNKAGSLNATNLTASAALSGASYLSATNCSSSAAPAVCGSAAAGSVVIAAGGTTVTVNTTAPTANSQIFLLADDTLGTKLSVTCNSTLATLIGGLAVTARTAGTSFQITSGATPAVNPLCISYLIIN